MMFVDRTTEYAKKIVSGKVLKGKTEILCAKRHLDDMANKDFPYYFDVSSANRAIDIANELIILEGEEQCKLKTRGFQDFIIGSLFGWRAKDTNFLRYREAYIQMARQNGKSFLSATIANTIATFSGYMRGKIFCTATKQDQANIVWDELYKFIDGQDLNLGDKSSAFTINFRVTDDNSDNVSVFITLDNEEVKNIDNAQNKDLSYTLELDKLKELPIGEHTILIKADDKKGGTSFRNYTFNKVSLKPIVSIINSKEELNSVSSPITLKFNISDPENRNNLFFRAYLDNFKTPNIFPIGSDVKTFNIDNELLSILDYGEHNFTVEVYETNSEEGFKILDDNDKLLTTYIVKFNRISNGIDVEFKLNEFDTMPKKILIVPHGEFAKDSTMTVKVCNNYLDKSPTWEEATQMSKISRAYTFTNSSKTNKKWAIGVKIIITQGKSKTISILKGVKGGFE